MAKNREKKQDSRWLVLNWIGQGFSLFNLPLFSPFLLFCSTPYSFPLSYKHVQFNTPHHLFRRFYPFSRRTINFPDLNPGTTTTIDRFRFHSDYVPRVERGNAVCISFVPPCLPAWRHIYESRTPSIQSRYLVRLSLSLSASIPRRLPRDETYQTLLLAFFTSSFPLLIFLSPVSFHSHLTRWRRVGVSELLRAYSTPWSHSLFST